MASETTLMAASPSRSARWLCAAGLLLVVLSIYVLTSPGRIDMIDGQARFDVSFNLVVRGRPVMTDPWIRPWMGVPMSDGQYYSYFGAPASVIAAPLVWLGLHEYPRNADRPRFLFSMTSPAFGAGISLLLFLTFLEFGLPLVEGLVWALVSAFATMVWPVSNSSFDNAQHAFFVLAVIYFGLRSARHGSMWTAAIAGLAGGVLILYQEYFLILIPALGISTLKLSGSAEEFQVSSESAAKGRLARLIIPVRADLDALRQLLRSAGRKQGEERASCVRFVIYLLTAVVTGLAVAAIYNHIRFGSYFDDGKLQYSALRGFPNFGNPLSGFVTLVLSPGKSIFLYSPPLILGIFGICALRRHNRALVLVTLTASISLVAFLSCIAYAGGDWCWGPRYITPLLPMWALSFPFVMRATKIRRDVVIAIVGLGLVVQVMALSVEHQRFFFERGLEDFFWKDPSFYLKHSALFARIGEILSLNGPLPKTATMFNSIPIPDWCTYTVLGPPPEMPRSLAPQWITQFKIFYLPRPWPLWMQAIRPELRPINLRVWVIALLTIGISGLGLMLKGLGPQLGGDVARELAPERVGESS